MAHQGLFISRYAANLSLRLQPRVCETVSLVLESEAVHLLVMAWLVLCASAGADGAPDGTRAGAAQAGSTLTFPIAVKQTKRVTVAFLDHTGTYWSIGRTVNRLRDYMQDHGMDTPLWVRSYLDPPGVGFTPLRMQVGFVIADGQTVSRPLQTVVRDPEWIAYSTVEGRAPLPRQDYRRIFDWLGEQEHEASGAVTEVYGHAQGQGPNTPRRVEIQVSLRPSASLATRTAAREFPDRRAAENSEASPGQVTAKTGVSDPSDWRTDHASAAQGSRSLGLSVSTPEAASIRDSATAAEAEAEPCDRFVRIAEQLLPEDQTIPDALSVWLGQVVLRMGAAARGVQHLYPDGDHAAVKLVDAIDSRYRSISASLTVDPLSRATAYVDVHSDPLAAPKRRIMHDLDTLLGRIALRTIDAAGTGAQLEAIAERLRDLLRSAAVSRSKTGRE